MSGDHVMLSSNSSRVTESGYCPQTSCRSISTTTAIALLAIGAVVIGITAILLALQGTTTGLGAIGWKGGVGLVAAGMGFFGLMIYTACRSAKQKENKNNTLKPDDQPVELTAHERLLVDLKDKKRAKEILQSEEMTLDEINDLLPHLTAEDIPLIHENLLTAEQFPWEEVIEKENIGYWLHAIHSFVLLKTYFPFQAFSKNQVEFDKFMGAGKFEENSDWPQAGEEFVKSVLNALDWTTIQALAPQLSALNHLALFSEGKLESPHFPWFEFKRDRDFVAALRRLPCTQFSKLISLSRIDLAELSQDEIQFLFCTDTAQPEGTPTKRRKLSGNGEWSDTYTRRIFRTLACTTIKKIVPKLTLHHLFFFGDKIKEKEFPWEEFLQLEWHIEADPTHGIVEKRFLAIQFLCNPAIASRLSLYTLPHFPWDKLTDNDIDTIIPVKGSKTGLDTIPVHALAGWIQNGRISKENYDNLGDSKKKELKEVHQIDATSFL